MWTEWEKISNLHVKRKVIEYTTEHTELVENVFYCGGFKREIFFARLNFFTIHCGLM